LTASVCHYAFLRDDGQPLAFHPGQFIQIHFHHSDGHQTKRSYSLANRRDSAADADAAAEIVVSQIPGGAGTAFLDGLNIGDRIMASGAHGTFHLYPDGHHRRHLMIATGTGISAFRAMSPQLGHRMAQDDIEAVLLFGVRTPLDLLFADEFYEFSERFPRFRFVPCFSREMPQHPRPDDRQGHVQAHLAAFEPNPQTDSAYLCGNPQMVDACTSLLKSAGLRMAQIRREKFIPNS
jgi:ferredoxin-NADP reductase